MNLPHTAETVYGHNAKEKKGPLYKLIYGHKNLAYLPFYVHLAVAFHHNNLAHLYEKKVGKPMGQGYN